MILSQVKKLESSRLLYDFIGNQNVVVCFKNIHDPNANQKVAELS